MAAAQRHKDINYRRWIKLLKGLYMVKDVLCPHVEDVLKDFHQNELTATFGIYCCDALTPVWNKTTHTWSLNGGPACIHRCADWLNRIAAEHVQYPSIRKDMFKLCDLTQLNTSPWEIAKAYMADCLKAQSTKALAELDPYYLMRMITDCKLFTSIHAKVEKVHQTRNALAHAAQQGINTDREVEERMDEMIDLVKLLPKAPAATSGDLEKVRDAKLEEVSQELSQRDMEIVRLFTQDQQLDILGDRIVEVMGEVHDVGQRMDEGGARSMGEVQDVGQRMDEGGARSLGQVQDFGQRMDEGGARIMGQVQDVGQKMEGGARIMGQVQDVGQRMEGGARIMGEVEKLRRVKEGQSSGRQRESQRDSTQSKYRKDKPPNQLTVNFKVHVTAGDGRQVDQGADVEMVKEKVGEAMRDFSSPLRETLYKTHNLKNVTFSMRKSKVPITLEIFASTTLDAKQIGNDCLNGRIAEIVEKNVSLRLPDNAQWKLQVEEFDMGMWQRVCDNLDSQVKVTRREIRGQTGDMRSAANEGIHEASIVANVAFSLLSSNEHSWFEFYLHIKKYQQLVDFTKSRNIQGESLLHVLAQNQKIHHIQVIFYLGLFETLRYVPAVGESRFAGFLPCSVAERYSTTARGVRFLDEYDKFSEWDDSLGALAKACRAGNEEDVKVLLKSCEEEAKLGVPAQGDHPGRNATDMTGSNCLYWACVSGNASLFATLAREGIDVNRVNKRGENNLHVACKLGHSHLVPMLIQEYKMDPLVEDQSGMTPQDYIAVNGHVETLEQVYKLQQPISGRLLPAAASHGHMPLVEYLTKECELNINSEDKTGKTALLTAADNQRSNMIMHLLKEGADVTKTDRRGRNILHFLAEHKSNDVLKELIAFAKERGIQLQDVINAQDVYIGGELCFLLKGKDSGRRAWHYAEVKRWLVALFLKKTKRGRVDVQVFGKTICSGWNCSPRLQDIAQMESVFDERKQQSKSQPRDCTPLHCCVYHDNATMAKMLLEEGADPNIPDAFGQTTAHLAAMRGNLAMLQLLEDSSTNLARLDAEARSPADVAELNEHGTIVNFLEGKKYYHTVEDFHARGRAMVAHLVQAKLEAHRRNGEDIRKNSIAVLRDLQVAIHEALLQLGSGPVQEESSLVIPVSPLVSFSSIGVGAASSAFGSSSWLLPRTNTGARRQGGTGRENDNGE